MHKIYKCVKEAKNRRLNVGELNNIEAERAHQLVARQSVSTRGVITHFSNSKSNSNGVACDWIHIQWPHFAIVNEYFMHFYVYAIKGLERKRIVLHFFGAGPKNRSIYGAFEFGMCGTRTFHGRIVRYTFEFRCGSLEIGFQ